MQVTAITIATKTTAPTPMPMTPWGTSADTATDAAAGADDTSLVVSSDSGHKNIRVQ